MYYQHRKRYRAKLIQLKTHVKVVFKLTTVSTERSGYLLVLLLMTTKLLAGPLPPNRYCGYWTTRDYFFTISVSVALIRLPKIALAIVRIANSNERRRLFVK